MGCRVMMERIRLANLYFWACPKKTSQAPPRSEKQAEKNSTATTAGVVRNSWYAKALDDPFREIEHKTSTMERSEHR